MRNGESEKPNGDGSSVAARPLSRLSILWPLVAVFVLGAGWELFSARFETSEPGPLRMGAVVMRASANLARTFRELSPPAAPRIAIFGSSQIANVKGADGQPSQALPSRLHDELSQLGVASEIVDFSEGGQQLAESMLALFASVDATRPSVVVVGVSLFSMLSLDVREALLAGIDSHRVKDLIVAHLPADAPAEDLEDLLAFSRRASQRLSLRGETIQQRVDRQLGAWLEGHLASVANREVMFRDLLDTPIRKDLAMWFKRQVQAARTARTYRIGSAYAASLLGLESMSALCRSRGVAFVTVLLPFDGSRPPTPFGRETLERIRSDLARLAGRGGFALLDASYLLSTDHFADFVDGSPDNLHFDAEGHARLAEMLARSLAPTLESRPTTSAEPVAGRGY